MQVHVVRARVVPDVVDQRRSHPSVQPLALPAPSREGTWFLKSWEMSSFVSPVARYLDFRQRL